MQNAGLTIAAYYQLGATPADIDHEPLAMEFGQTACRTEVHQPRLLLSRYHIDRMTELFFGSGNKFTGVGGQSQRVCTNGANDFGVHILRNLAKTPNAIEPSLEDPAGYLAAGSQTSGQADHFPDVFDRLQLAINIMGQDHMKTVRPEIDSSINLFFVGIAHEPRSEPGT
jgi:hypothetical protein